jgi:hypothetical protein
MQVSKEERYAMIRRAALKIQKRNKVSRANTQLAREVIALDEQDCKSKISWADTDRYVATHYSDVYEANVQPEEWS